MQKKELSGKWKIDLKLQFANRIAMVLQNATEIAVEIRSLSSEEMQIRPISFHRSNCEFWKNENERNFRPLIRHSLEYSGQKGSKFAEWDFSDFEKSKILEEKFNWMISDELIVIRVPITSITAQIFPKFLMIFVDLDRSVYRFVRFDWAERKNHWKDNRYFPQMEPKLRQISLN